MSETDPQRPDLEAVRQAIASGDPVQAMPAITKLRHCSDAEAVPLLVLGTEQKPFLVRSLSCSGLGYKRTCLLYTSPSPRDRQKSRMPSSA